MINDKYHYFSVMDDYTGLDIRFRWREAFDFRELYKQLANYE